VATVFASFSKSLCFYVINTSKYPYENEKHHNVSFFPEDTSENRISNGREYSLRTNILKMSNKHKYIGKAKCIFWTIIAIIFSIGLGQLQ